MAETICWMGRPTSLNLCQHTATSSLSQMVLYFHWQYILARNISLLATVAFQYGCVEAGVRDNFPVYLHLSVLTWWFFCWSCHGAGKFCPAAASNYFSSANVHFQKRLHEVQHFPILALLWMALVPTRAQQMPRLFSDDSPSLPLLV